MFPVNNFFQFQTTYSDVFRGCMAHPPFTLLQKRNDIFRTNDLSINFIYSARFFLIEFSRSRICTATVFITSYTQNINTLTGRWHREQYNATLKQPTIQNFKHIKTVFMKRCYTNEILASITMLLINRVKEETIYIYPKKKIDSKQFD